MSYRAFKRLLGETSLERKCRFLFGSGVVVLITLSFWLYAYQTEQLAYEQALTTCRLLVQPTFAQHHFPLMMKANPQVKQPGNLEDVVLKDPGKEYQYQFTTGKSFDDSFERELYGDFERGKGKTEDWRQRP